MSSEPIPLVIEDISAFSKALGRQLKEDAASPGHLKLMNMIARATGFRNYQHLLASNKKSALRTVNERSEVDQKLMDRALRRFDAEGQFVSWPTRQKVQDLCVWAMWARLPPGASLHEKEVSQILNRWHTFKDPAILRRRLITLKLATREIDGSNYRRVETRPPPDALRLIAEVSRRSKPD